VTTRAEQPEKSQPAYQQTFPASERTGNGMPALDGIASRSSTPLPPTRMSSPYGSFRPGLLVPRRPCPQAANQVGHSRDRLLRLRKDRCRLFLKPRWPYALTYSFPLISAKAAPVRLADPVPPGIVS